MLTPAQREVVFEILDIPSFDQVGLMIDPDHLATFAINYGDSAKRTSAYVDGMLKLIDTISSKEEMLIKYITDWNMIGTDPSSQENGAVGSLTGIMDDPTKELKIIRGRVERLLCIREWNESRMVTRQNSVQFGAAIAG